MAKKFKLPHSVKEMSIVYDLIRNHKTLLTKLEDGYEKMKQENLAAEQKHKSSLGRKAIEEATRK